MAFLPLLFTFCPSILLLLALPWAGLPDSLDTLANMAARLQSVVTLAFNHPVWAIVAIVFTIGLLQILADLVKRLIKISVAFVLKLPLALSQWVWKRATTTADSPDVKIDRLVNQLDKLRVEQDQVIAELKLLLLQRKAPTPNSTALGKLLTGASRPEQIESKEASTTKSASS